MSVRRALRAAVGDLYRHSLKLLALNTLLSVAVTAAVLATIAAPPAILVAPLLVGPVAAALAHAAVVLRREGELRLSDMVGGLRHWRRGTALAALDVAVLGVGAVAVRFYFAGGTRLWPLGAATVYLLALFLAYQLPLWPLAVAEPERELRAALRDAGVILLRRPRALVGLALALLVVNLAGTAAILPLLSLTVAYSFLAAAHFALPPHSTTEETDRWPA
jgi:hypothetical protein